jgi:hypothetical protein
LNETGGSKIPLCGESGLLRMSPLSYLETSASYQYLSTSGYPWVSLVTRKRAMTEYELIDAINGTTDLLTTSFSMYVTFTTAYLICAYMVGGSLNRQQCFVITVLYVASTGVSTLTMLSIGARILDLYDTLKLTNPARIGLAHDWIYIELATLSALGMFAGVKFMWDIRHPKTE